ncbi:hypothetical protein [Methylobacterium sp. JK268]
MRKKLSTRQTLLILVTVNAEAITLAASLCLVVPLLALVILHAGAGARPGTGGVDTCVSRGGHWVIGFERGSSGGRMCFDGR